MIAQKESFLGLYKGLGAVISGMPSLILNRMDPDSNSNQSQVWSVWLDWNVILGIVPKMSIRFASFETYKGWLADQNTGKVSSTSIFFCMDLFFLLFTNLLWDLLLTENSPPPQWLAGLGAGTTEAVAIVCPMEVVKIRLQAQMHSMSDPLDIPKCGFVRSTGHHHQSLIRILSLDIYLDRNAGHALYLILREEGPRTLYRGVALTALRQATNQAANFTAYTELKALCQRLQPKYHEAELPSYQTLVLGLISGAVGPFTNAPIDTIKTRIQKSTATQGETAWTRLKVVSGEMFVQEGPKAFYKGITPRVMRVAPGQAVVFTVCDWPSALGVDMDVLISSNQIIIWSSHSTGLRKS